MANETNLKPWKPGQSGNPSGRPRKRITGIVEDILDNDPKQAEELAEEWLRKAKEDPSLFRELLNRLEGKVPDQVEMRTERKEPDLDDLPDDDLSHLERIAGLLAEGGPGGGETEASGDSLPALPG